MTDNHLQSVKEVYDRRDAVNSNLYSWFRAEVVASRQERQRKMLKMLKRLGYSNMAELSILEVGCGKGDNLLEFLAMGAMPDKLTGNDLSDHRLSVAKQRLPAAISLNGGDATALGFADGSFDIVYQSTVFSSILDDEVQTALARKMWKWVRPGGGVMWYDFTYNNPSNPDVRGVPRSRYKALFPEAELTEVSLTLAPPISRRLGSHVLYGLLNTLPLLRTHRLAFFGKPAAGHGAGTSAAE